MLPKFISEELAKKVNTYIHCLYVNNEVFQIMTIGKSINFLRQRCQDHTELFTVEERNWFIDGGQ